MRFSVERSEDGTVTVGAALPNAAGRSNAAGVVVPKGWSKPYACFRQALEDKGYGPPNKRAAAALAATAFWFLEHPNLRNELLGGADFHCDTDTLNAQNLWTDEGQGVLALAAAWRDAWTGTPEAAEAFDWSKVFPPGWSAPGVAPWHAKGKAEKDAVMGAATGVVVDGLLDVHPKGIDLPDTHAFAPPPGKAGAPTDADVAKAITGAMLYAKGATTVARYDAAIATLQGLAAKADAYTAGVYGAAVTKLQTQRASAQHLANLKNLADNKKAIDAKNAKDALAGKGDMDFVGPGEPGGPPSKDGVPGIPSIPDGLGNVRWTFPDGSSVTVAPNGVTVVASSPPAPVVTEKGPNAVTVLLLSTIGAIAGALIGSQLVKGKNAASIGGAAGGLAGGLAGLAVRD